jgi:hypothetical protein
MIFGFDPKRVASEVDGGRVLFQDPRSETFRLLLELLHQLGTRDPLWEPRVVLDIGGQHELSAVSPARDHDRLQLGPGGIDRRRVSRGAAPDDDQRCPFRVCRHFSLRRSLEECVELAGSLQRRELVVTADVHVADEDLRNRATLAAPLQHLGLPVGIDLDVDLFPNDPFRMQEPLRTLTVRAQAFGVKKNPRHRVPILAEAPNPF